MAQQAQSLSTSSSKRVLSVSDDGQYAVSIYDDALTEGGTVMSIAALKLAFPTLPKEFYGVLIDRIRVNKFTDERFSDAVGHVIDTCKYKNPTIADIISYDKNVKAYTYKQMIDMADKYGADVWKSHEPVKLAGMVKPVWIHVNDIRKFNIKSTE